MKSSPLVSVIIATYRREVPLEKALRSLADQNYTPYEIIVVDDNDDPFWNHKVCGVVEKIKSENEDLSIRLLVNHPNLGSAKARNAGISVANGEYITFLDDDDLYLPDKIKNQLDAMLEYNADYSLTALALYDESGRLIDYRDRGYIKDFSQKELLRCHLMYHMTGTDTMMFRKDYLVKIGGFPPIDVGDEFYLMLEAIKGGGVFCCYPHCDVKAYVHSGEHGLSAGETKIKGENDLFAYKKTLFTEIDKESRRYIIMRHYAVISFAELRRKRYGSVLKNAFLSFVADPKGCLSLLKERGNSKE